MVTQLSKGANAPLPAGPLRVEVRSGVALDLSALLVTAADRVRSDDDFVFFNQPAAPGVRLAGAALEVDPAAVPPDVEKVVVVASVDATPGTPSTFGAVGPLVVAVAAGGQDVVHFTPDGLGAETALMLVEVYRRQGAWKVRGVGQGWSSGLAGIATDFGVSVLDGSAPPPSGPPQHQAPHHQAPSQQPQQSFQPAPPPAQHQAPQHQPAQPLHAPQPPHPQQPQQGGFFQPPGGGQAPAQPFQPTAPPAQHPAPAYQQPQQPQQPQVGGFFQPPGGGQAPPAPAAPAGPGYGQPPAQPGPAPYTLDHGPVRLQKDQTVTLSKGGQPYLQRVIMGLGWDPADRGARIDLDASCLALGAGGRELGRCWYRDKDEFRGAIRHSGDDLSGHGGGDDELIFVDLQALPHHVEALVFCVNSYSGHRFTQVRNAWCRLVDDGTRSEMVRYDLGTGASSTGVMMALVHRSGPGWAMTALGLFQDGRTVKDMAGYAAHVWRQQAAQLNRPSW